MWKGMAGLPAFTVSSQRLGSSQSQAWRTWVIVPSCGPAGAMDHKVSLERGNKVPGATRAGERYGLAAQSLS